jgi:hypothetical protein
VIINWSGNAQAKFRGQNLIAQSLDESPALHVSSFASLMDRQVLRALACLGSRYAGERNVTPYLAAVAGEPHTVIVM